MAIAGTVFMDGLPKQRKFIFTDVGKIIFLFFLLRKLEDSGGITSNQMPVVDGILEKLFYKDHDISDRSVT